jgi:hypothetical protein
MHGGRAEKLNQKCKMAEQKNARRSGREIKPEMQDGRAKKMCGGRAEKLNQKCKMAEQKNARRSGREIKPKMQDGRAKKCAVVEQRN